MNHRALLSPLRERLAEGRPVFTREQALDLTKRIMAMTAVEDATVSIKHTVRSVTKLAADQIQDTDDGESLRLSIRAVNSGGLGFVSVNTNQLETSALREMVARADALVKGMIGSTERLRVQAPDEQDTYRPAHLWYDATIAAMRTVQDAVVPQIIDTARRQQLHASGFIGVMARAEAVLTVEGITAYSDETDSEVDVTVRPADGTVSGWSGQAARDWTTLDPVRVATEAADIAVRSVKPSAVEPGRRTAILAPGAVVQLMRFLVPHFHGIYSDDGMTAFSKVPGARMGSRWEQRMFDPRLQITSDPADPEGGYIPWFGKGYANPAMTWIDKGMLKNLAYGPIDALSIGKAYAELPFGFRLHGGATTLDQMIAQCEEGIYVHRVSSVDIVDMSSGMLTGVTRDGCFLVKKGKIDRPVKNFRFITSPFFFLNTLVTMGPTQRTAFGYAPPTRKEINTTSKDWPSDFFDWPRRPMIVPPLMVNDFNFSGLVDAV